MSDFIATLAHVFAAGVAPSAGQVLAVQKIEQELPCLLGRPLPKSPPPDPELLEAAEAFLADCAPREKDAALADLAAVVAQRQKEYR